MKKFINFCNKAFDFIAKIFDLLFLIMMALFIFLLIIELIKEPSSGVWFGLVFCIVSSVSFIYFRFIRNKK